MATHKRFDFISYDEKGEQIRCALGVTSEYIIGYLMSRPPTQIGWQYVIQDESATVGLEAKPWDTILDQDQKA